MTLPLPGGVPAAAQLPPVGTRLAPGFAYAGGAIIADPQVFASFWGPSWTDPANAQTQANIVQFVQDILASDYVNVVSQYGVGLGAGRCGTWRGASCLPSAHGQLADSDVQEFIQSLIGAGTLPEPGSPPNLALLIFLDEAVEIRDSGIGIVMCEPTGGTAFGYHHFFTTHAGNRFYYSVIPALDDNCLRESCTDDLACAVHLAQTQEQRRTQVASHELAEMLTDPELTGWRDGSNSNEVGDLCNGLSGTISVSGRMWTVQRIYSLTDDQRAQPACSMGAIAPMARLALAPASTAV
jgi:hypothetical protein